MSTTPLQNCPLCPRLAEFRHKNTQKFPGFYNGAVDSFGPDDASLLIVGLAPGLKGANATSRPFTGDYAGEILYPALLKTGFANEANSHATDNGYLKHYTTNSPLQRYSPAALQLVDCRITNAVRCVPPENKPTGEEISQCNPFLTQEIANMKNVRAILSLGLIAHKAVLKSLGQKQSHFTFRHGARHEITLPAFTDTQREVLLFNSYHTSRYNINTRKLTEEMFQEVIQTIQNHLFA